jgi:hypothetical protein
MEPSVMSERHVPARWKYARLVYYLVVGAWVVYAILTIFAPNVAKLRFHISPMTLFLLQLTIIVPVHLIWLTAVRGAEKFKNYALMIAGGKEGRAINYIADGLLWTIGYLIVSAVTGAAAQYFTGHELYDVLVVLRDHLAPICSLIAFMLIYRGSHLLRDVADFETWTPRTMWALVAYCLFAAYFVYQFAASPVLSSTAAGHNSASVMPHSLLLFTMIVPFLVAWFLGIAAIINISKYAHHVKGHIYRSALQRLVQGLVVVMAFSVAIQFLTFGARYTSTLSLGLLLALVYALMILYAAGFWLVGQGAGQLAKLESAV